MTGVLVSVPRGNAAWKSDGIRQSTTYFARRGCATYFADRFVGAYVSIEVDGYPFTVVGIVVVDLGGLQHHVDGAGDQAT